MNRGQKRMLIIVGFIGVIILLMVLAWFVFLTSADRHLIMQKPSVFEIGGQQRTYRMYVPETLNNDTKVIFVFDGFGGNGRRIAYYSAFHNVASDSIVVYPDPVDPEPGQIRGWNAGFCCGSGWVQKVDDIGFVIGLASEIAKKHNLHTDRFYAVGFSNGAFLSQRLAAEAPDKLRGVVSVSGTIGTKDTSLKPKAPVPILLIHGRADKVVPFDGGARFSEPDFVWRSHDETFNVWQEANQDKAATETYIHDDGHKWLGYRTYNIWDSRPEGSDRAVQFIREN